MTHLVAGVFCLMILSFIALVTLTGWAALFFLSLFLVMTMIEYLRPKRPGVPWDYLRLCYLMYTLLFVLVPFHYQTDTGGMAKRLQPLVSDLLFANLLLLAGYIMIVAGYYCKGRDFATLKNEMSGPIHGLRSLGLVFFLFGVASFLVYANIYGGIFELFGKVDLIRAGVVGESGFVFVRKFFPFVTLGAWIFIARLQSRQPHRTVFRMLSRFFLAIALLALAVAATVATAGRLDVLFVLIPVMLAPSFFQGRVPQRLWLAMSVLAGVLWILLGKQVFEFMTYGGRLALNVEADAYFRLLAEFRHPFESLLAAFSNVPYPHGVRGLTDIYLALDSLLPSKLLGLEVKETLSMLNTFLLVGINKAVIPPGILGFFYHAFSWPGLLFGCFVFGWAMRVMEELFLERMQGELFIAYLYVAFGVTFLYFMMAGDPVVYLQNYFWLISGTVVVFLLQRLHWRPEKRREPSVTANGIVN